MDQFCLHCFVHYAEDVGDIIQCHKACHYLFADNMRGYSNKTELLFFVLNCSCNSCYPTTQHSISTLYLYYAVLWDSSCTAVHPCQSMHYQTSSYHPRHGSIWYSVRLLNHLHVSPSQFSCNVTTGLIMALILSYLYYCKAVLDDLLASTMVLFQRVLHTAAHTVLDMKPRICMTPADRELHVALVTSRTEIPCKLCLLVHKLLLGQPRNTSWTY